MGSVPLTLHSAVRSDLGRRENNEDAVLATGRLVAVADGVGGAAAGEVASRMVIDAMAALDRRRLAGALAAEFADAVRDANQRLGFVISCRPQLTGMASTLTAVALANDGHYLVANVGDSRTYLLRGGHFQQLTRDHSLVQTLIDHGAISPEQAREHPQRSVVLEALDGRDRSLPEITTFPGQAGDRLLLCSDGLSDVVSDDQIAAILGRFGADEASARLIRLALDQGGRDNISVAIADVVVSAQESEGWLDVLPA